MLYNIFKIIARLAIRIFCRKIIINKPGILKIKGPVLLACNHPNSFLDSVILDTLFQPTVWNLARGDSFINKKVKQLFFALKILPVYRTSEGVENISENYKTFDSCISIFRKKGVVAIFSEGKCINEWHLRPLKKGTARLALKAWEENLPAGRQGIPLTVIPVGLNYSSFSRFGKNIFINFGNPIKKENINMDAADGAKHQEFNNLLQEQLEKLVFEIGKKDTEKQKEILSIKISLLKKIILALPAVLGYILHFPLYFPIKKYVWKRTFRNDHYDSVMTGILIFTYPIYLLLIVILLLLTPICWWSPLIFFIFPFTAWSYVQVKPQLDK